MVTPESEMGSTTSPMAAGPSLVLAARQAQCGHAANSSLHQSGSGADREQRRKRLGLGVEKSVVVRKTVRLDRAALAVWGGGRAHERAKLHHGLVKVAGPRGVHERMCKLPQQLPP